MHKIPLFDAHCDTLNRALYSGENIAKNKLHIDLARLGNYAPAAQVFAIWDLPDRPSILERALAFWQQQEAQFSDQIALCRTPEQLRQANAQGKIGALLSVEGADQFACDRSRLPELRRRGVSIIHLCWNDSNCLCGAAVDGGGGLTAEGRAFVEACWDNGICIDLSHISDAAFWDMAELSSKAGKPLLAGHSDCRSLCARARNLTDPMIDAILASNGCIGLNFYPVFLGGTEDSAEVLRHAEHILSRGGEKNLCLGSDWDGIERTPADMHDVSDSAYLYNVFLQNGYAEALVQDIFYNNLLRTWEANFR